jgi:hypothetical protein
MTPVAELNHLIMMDLPIQSILEARSTNHKMAAFFEDEYFWKKKTYADFGPVSQTFSTPPFENYKTLTLRKYPQSADAQHAVAAGREDELKWLLTHGVKPTFKGANWAARNGNIKIMKFLYDKLKILPDVTGANWAASEGHLEVIQWLDTHKIRPCIYGYRMAEKRGQTKVIEWLNSKLQAVQ